MNTLEDRLDFIRKGMGVRRYHQRHTFTTDTVGKHSAGVAMFLVLMDDNKLPSSQLLVSALAHDLPEWVIGDIPSPAKRAMSSAARADLAILEDQLLCDNGLRFDLTDNEERQLKLADAFDGLMFCIEERRRGNREVYEVGEKYISYLYEYIYYPPTGELREEATFREQRIFDILKEWWRAA